MLIADGFEDSEFRQPLDALVLAGHDVVIVGPRAGTVLTGKKARESVPVDRPVDGIAPADFDAVVIPGGYSPDRLRILPAAVAFVLGMHEAGRLLATICHGPWLLIEADLVRGRRVTGWASVRTDVRNAGGHWIDAPVVVEGNMITSRGPDDLDQFSAAVLADLAQRGSRAA